MPRGPGAARPAATPPGWPPGVPPPRAPGWERAATSWLLDQCPADFRAYDAWQRHPSALAWVATHHIDAQLRAMRECYRKARVELGEQLPEGAMPAVMDQLAAEGRRLRAAERAAGLVQQALRGTTFVPRL
ncbi:hypothetical protein PZ938_14470 [Luteipulveratus sp. YIM 133132]|uniref:Uncharacterized protein n=1 Tax=Luteipulveratus flavus TaxID=3031728 RepID=A0ABT6CAB6_9MICO|nr:MULTISPECIES: hypothetical protein [unclassified Luteipulveratus]MDE9366816.1 hypothetical protein [Luteipulveratus sp. YIM 133132]MDF8265848.1 hypothetical protein [Luteipulveratus sp. YIM 133296]